MKLSPAEQESILAIIIRIYGEIYAIEEEYKLLAGQGDYRPRIDYFHDAVRAFAAQAPGEQDKRLSVEMLAYDVSCLRYIQSMPLSPFRAQGESMTPQTDIVAVQPGIAIQAPRASRAMREKLSELYQHYAVLFAALLKPMADRDYHERVDTINQDVREMNGLVDALSKLSTGKGSLGTVANAVHHLEDDMLRQLLISYMQQKKMQQGDIKKMMQALKNHVKRKDKEAANIDGAHMNYALAQLGLYENSKDMLKKMAAQGMNLVGKFVEASVAATKREMGR